jgi:hypothetical protein
MDVSIEKKIKEVTDKFSAAGIFAKEVMPVWDDDKRAITNSIARSAVFSVVEKGTSERLIEQKVPAPSNYDITITGKQLSESDRDVYLQVMHSFRGRGPDEEISINPRDFLLSIGRQDGKANREWLWEVLTTIAQTLLKITINLPDGRKIKFVGSLLTITTEEKYGISDEIIIRLPLDALRLYNQDTRTLLSMERRLALKGTGSQLAKSLQAKIYSHKNPFPMKIETLMQVCGSRSARIRDFKRKLIQALDMLVNNKDIADYHISKEGLVYINRISL